MAEDAPQPRSGRAAAVRARLLQRLRFGERVRPKWQPPVSDEPPVDLEDTMVLRRRQETAEASHAESTHAEPPAPPPLVPQPHLAQLARRRVSLTLLGMVLALLGAGLMLGASVLTDGVLAGGGLRSGLTGVWPAVANVCAVLVLLVCLLQWRVWVAAWLEWRAVRAAHLSPWLGLSMMGGWLAVVAVALEAFAAWRSTLLMPPGTAGELLTWAGLVASIAAVVLGGLRAFIPTSARWRAATFGSDEATMPLGFSERD